MWKAKIKTKKKKGMPMCYDATYFRQTFLSYDFVRTVVKNVMLL